MKKSKLLMLSTVAPLISVVPAVTVVSCGDDAHKGKSKFVCDDTRQETAIGESACWYTFNLTGTEEITKDLNIEADVDPNYLVEQPLWHVDKENPKQLHVGIDGKTKNLTEGFEVPFKLNFKSNDLKLSQSFVCTYVYHKPKIMSISDRIESQDPSALVEHFFSFSLVDTSTELSQLEVSVINADDRSSDLPEPSILEDIQSRGEGKFDVKVCLPGDGTTTIGQAGDYANFDLEFHNKENTWHQVITNFSFQFEEVSYQQCTTNEETKVVIDYKGTKQKALKAIDEGGNGVLKTTTPVGTPFEIFFNLSDWKDEWTKGSQWKFGSYVHPEHSHVPYYHYSSISVYARYSSNAWLEKLRQTEPGDYEGDNGYWWVSEGGPITVLYDKIVDDLGEPTSIIFKLRTGEVITNESSFYVTYA